MKKVVALVMSMVMLLSVAALADTGLRMEPKAGGPSVTGGISVLRVTVDGKAVETAPVAVAAEPSQLVKDLTAAIGEAGMAGAFGSALENAAEYELFALQDFSADSVNADMVVDLAVPGITADVEVVTLLGLVVDGNVEWANVEVVSVGDGVLSIALTEELVAASQGVDAVIAILVK